MRFLGLIIAVEPREYQPKDTNKPKVKQVRCTCIDYDPSNIRLKDTVDVTISEADFTLIKGLPVGQQIYFDVSEIRPSKYSARLDFTARLEMTQFQVEAKPGK